MRTTNGNGTAIRSHYDPRTTVDRARDDLEHVLLLSDVARPAASAQLSSRAREMFDLIVAAFPPDHFIAADAPLLNEYVACLDKMQRLDIEIELTGGPVVEEVIVTKAGETRKEAINQRFIVRDRILQNALKLARHLRLTPAARHRKESAVNRPADVAMQHAPTLGGIPGDLLAN